MANETEGLVWQADAHDDLSVALELAGRKDEALEVARRALELSERKGSVPRIERLRARIELLRSAH